VPHRLIFSKKSSILNVSSTGTPISLTLAYFKKGGILMSTYDLVVIGAGNGGLSAACVASAIGLKTLLVEQHNLPGGLATSFVRGRFEFEPSLHECSIGKKENHSSLISLFNRYGVNVNWCDVPEAYRLIVTGDDNIDISLPFGAQEYIEAIENAIPGSKECVAKFMEICTNVAEGFGYLGMSKGKPDLKILASEYGNLLRTSGVSLADVEDFLNMPKKVRKIINVFWSYLGLDSAQIDFQIYALVIYSFLNHGANVPEMRSHEIAMALDTRIRENGGSILYHTKVTDIHVRDGKVTAVNLSNGQQVETEHVIADVTPHIVFSQLIKPEAEIPTKQVKMANSRKNVYSGATVYLGLNKSMEELNLNEYSHFIFPSGDDRKLYADTSSIETSKAQLTVCLNAAVPGCSPEGTTILYFLVIYNEKAWEKVEAKDYFKLKNKIAKEAVSYFEEATGVYISDYIEEIEVATPVTFARYTGNYRGDVLGYLPKTWDSVLARNLMMEEDNSINGLRFCGKALIGGYGPTLSSGETAAYLTLNDIKEETK
jgi:phytoene dehydrogenase-like protein